jgi:hypothetical protein
VQLKPAAVSFSGLLGGAHPCTRIFEWLRAAPT